MMCCGGLVAILSMIENYGIEVFSVSWSALLRREQQFSYTDIESFLVCDIYILN